MMMLSHALSLDRNPPMQTVLKALILPFAMKYDLRLQPFKSNRKSAVPLLEPRLLRTVCERGV